MEFDAGRDVEAEPEVRAQQRSNAYRPPPRDACPAPPTRSPRAFASALSRNWPVAWLLLRWLWPRRREGLVLVRPITVDRCRREGLRRWRRGARRPGTSGPWRRMPTQEPGPAAASMVATAGGVRERAPLVCACSTPATDGTVKVILRRAFTIGSPAFPFCYFRLTIGQLTMNLDAVNGLPSGAVTLPCWARFSIVP